jgi:phosphoribosylamine--glycine ligase
MDDPQPLGLVDRLTAQGVLCYGPTRAASQIEASKAFSKQLMLDSGIRTSAFRSFNDYATAAAYLEERGDRPCWVKASGLAAGKGAIGCSSLAEALNALDIAMRRRDFGSAGDTVVIEDSLSGWETSAHAICDGARGVLWPFASDHKRAQDGDTGLNTGGMGAYSPSEKVSGALAHDVQTAVVDRVLAAMAERGTPYTGTLFPGMMVTGGGAYVLEFNARFGDPETQVLLPRMQGDLFALCRAAATGDVSTVDITWSPDAAVGVVMASGGYPATYKLGYPIRGLDAVDPDVLVFHAATAQDPRGLVTNGGRILTVVAMGPTIAAARDRAYDNVRRISFTDAQYRTDIAALA